MTIDPAVAAKAKLLFNSTLLSATFLVGANRLIEKQQVFLTVLGIKPVSQVSAAHWVGDPAKLESVADDTEALKKLFDQLGLSYHLFGDESELQAVVSLDAKLVDQFVHAPDDDNVTRGKLLGYPLTAIEYAETRHWRDDEPELLAKADLSGYPFFRFSREHYQEELATIRRWQQILAAYGLAT